MGACKMLPYLLLFHQDWSNNNNNVYLLAHNIIIIMLYNLSIIIDNKQLKTNVNLELTPALIYWKKFYTNKILIANFFTFPSAWALLFSTLRILDKSPTLDSNSKNLFQTLLQRNKQNYIKGLNKQGQNVFKTRMIPQILRESNKYSWRAHVILYHTKYHRLYNNRTYCDLSFSIWPDDKTRSNKTRVLLSSANKKSLPN